METEKLLTGYCRMLDQGRIVEVILEDGAVTEVDCCYPDCIHCSVCGIAESIRELDGKP